ncbi:MAG: MBOAT family protein, partial [Chloroflexia bacterium]|nr:MBOAT family protein [Chloroflexia bacterium]
MLFNSLEFAIFLPIVFFLYWFATNKNLRSQNLLIVAASFLFYGWWDWRFLLLMVVTITLSYLSGLAIRQVRNNREGLSARRGARLVTALNITLNLAILGTFKYYNFFVDSFVDAFSLFGRELSPRTLQVILPVGISFYTFQALSYTIDVYRRQISPTRNLLSFFAFVSFFPQLVAGPIERATNLLPQFQRKRVFRRDQAVDGLRQMLWGLFKKVVIADNCAVHVDAIFQDPAAMSGSTLVLGAL